MPLKYKRVDTPIGELKLIANDRGLSAILWHEDKPSAGAVESPRDPVLFQAASQLSEYFDGRRTNFTVPLDLQGTPFQKSVWDALRDIPFGETRSYLQIAERVGNKRACRAVGAANGRNPVPILVPCHRVIGASGSLTGFGGGLATKERLLALEGRGTGCAGA